MLRLGRLRDFRYDQAEALDDDRDQTLGTDATSVKERPQGLGIDLSGLGNELATRALLASREQLGYPEWHRSPAGFEIYLEIDPV